MRYILLSTALLVSACTQSPSGIVNRGGEGYTRNGSSGYTQPMGSISGPTYQAAEVGAISSGDLAPPPASVKSSDLPPPSAPAPQAIPSAPIAAPASEAPPLYVDDTVPPAPVPTAPVVTPSADTTTYETNPSHVLGKVRSGSTSTAPSATVTTTTTTITPASPADIQPVGKFIWPLKGKVIQGYGKKADGSFNDGINISANQGAPIVAAADGEVVYSGSELQGYGNMVILRHAGNVMTAYAHADRILVDKGDQVEQGVTIATVGKSGGVSAPQLHFGVRLNKEPVDPSGYLSGSAK